MKVGLPVRRTFSGHARVDRCVCHPMGETIVKAAHLVPKANQPVQIDAYVDQLRETIDNGAFSGSVAPVLGISNERGQRFAKTMAGGGPGFLRLRRIQSVVTTEFADGPIYVR